MIAGKRLIVVLPAYNAAATLAAVVAGLPPEVDRVILGDDASQDQTAALARKLGLEVHAHSQNRGYGANQKTCYDAALQAGADVVVMVHPDGQHPPSQVAALAGLVATGPHALAFGTRMRGNGARAGGMPWHRLLANRGLTAFQNRLLRQQLSEYHSGFRAYRRGTLEQLPYHRNADGFLFDSQLLLQAIWRGLPIGELAVPTRYGPESSSIRLAPAVAYGVGVMTGTLEVYRARSGGKVPDWLV